MSIEMAPKASTVTPAKAAEGSSGKQSADDSVSATRKDPGSFLSAFACVENSVSQGGSEGGAPAGAVADWWVPVGDALLSEQQPDTSASLATPAFLLTQLPVVPSPEVTPPGGALLAGGGRIKEGSSPLQAAIETNLGKSTSPQPKSGKAVLDAASDALSALQADAPSANTPGSGAVLTSGKEVVADRAHQMAQGLAESLVKTANFSTVSLAGNKERMQELQPSSRVVASDVSAQAWAVPQGVGGMLGSDGVVAGSAASAADGQFSEQVSYWIGTDIQKAEMTLDGFGANPVEVSISMQGKEATVVFRSDEALTRDALSNASGQLQDAMGRQGVVLSGVSVGTSNSGDSQRQGSGGRQPGWKAGAVEVVVGSAPVAGVKPGASGRSIDLFV